MICKEIMMNLINNKTKPIYKKKSCDNKDLDQAKEVKEMKYNPYEYCKQ